MAQVVKAEVFYLNITAQLSKTVGDGAIGDAWK